MTTKKLFAWVLALVLCISLFPVQSLAADTVTFTALDGTANNGDAQGYSKLLDGLNSTKWCDKIGTENKYTPYIVWKASEQVILTDYTFVTGDDSEKWTGRNPKDWALYGCNDYNESGKTGGTWVLIHSVTDDAVMQNLNRTPYKYTIADHHTMYQYYKLVVTANHGSQHDLIQLTAMTLGWKKAYITFDQNGGETEASPKIIPGGHGLPTTAPTKTDHRFLGWYTKNGADGDWGEAFTAETAAFADMTVYAKWEQLYWVTFDSNGGSALTNNKIYHSDPIPTEIPIKADVKFGGWFTKNGTETGDWGEQYTADTAVAENITVYAKWNTVSITFDKNGGDTEANPNVIASGENLPTVHPTYNGHRFLGWYTQDGTDGNWGEPFTQAMSDAALADLAVYAKWETVTITFEKNSGDTEASPTQCPFGQTPTTAPTKEGFTFLGWYTKNGMETGDWGEKYPEDVTTYEDMTVYAKWTATGMECLAEVTLTAISGTAGNKNESYDKLVDGKKIAGNFSKWCVSDFQGAEVILKASAYTVPLGYTLTTGNDNSKANGRNPKTWALYGSNDYDETEKTGTWMIIHSVTNDTAMKDENYKSYRFPVENTKAYRYFKFEITENQGGALMQLAEFEMETKGCEHLYDEPIVTAVTCTTAGTVCYTCKTCGLSVMGKVTAPTGHLPGENGLCAVCGNKYGAVVGDAVYTDLARAIYAASNSETDKTVTLYQDFNISGVIEVQGPATKGMTILDLNGYNIKNERGAVIKITDGGQLTLADGSVAQTGTISGCGSTGGAVFVASGKFVLNGGTISDSYADDKGGAVCVSGSASEMVMNGGTIKRCSAKYRGGAIYVSGKLIMNGGTITECTAVEEYPRLGGGVCLEGNGSSFEMTNGIISSCRAVNGGGVYTSMQTTITGGTIKECTTNSDGGAVYNAVGGTLTLNGGNLINNNASWGGAIENLGALYVISGEISGNKATLGGGICNDTLLNDKSSTCSISGGEIKNNTASESGGGIYNGNSLTISGGVIANNKATWYGAGIVNYGTIDMTNGEIKNNNVRRLGGGIYTKNSFSMTNGTISGNTSSQKGGGIFAESGTVTVGGGTIAENTGYGGGGICLNNGATATVSGGTISKNTSTSSESGGGILVDKASTLTISGGEIEENKAGGNGGGISAYSESILNVSGTVLVSGNTASNEGGGIQLAYGSVLNMTGGTVENNKASGNAGGGILFDNSTGTVKNALIKGNTVMNFGGGIHAKTSTVTLENTQITENYTYGGGGLSTQDSANVTVKGGKIFKNKSYQGCGLRIDADSVVTLQDGAEVSENGSPDGLYKNRAIFGAGVWIREATLNVNGGNIINNHAENGGGIYTYDADAVLNLQDGNISGNTATFESAGIASKTNRIFIKGGIQITGNKKTATKHSQIDSNLYLRNGTTIQVENPATIGEDGTVFAKIGVCVEAGKENVVAANDTDYSRYFTPDSAGGSLTYDPTDKIVKLGGSCTVIYDYGDGNTSRVAVNRNTAVTEPETAPTREGYHFGGWCLDYDMYDFSSKVTKDIVLKATWLEAGKIGVSLTPNKLYIVSDRADTKAYGVTYRGKQVLDARTEEVGTYRVIPLNSLELNLLNADKLSIFVWDSNLNPLCDVIHISLQ